MIPEVIATNIIGGLLVAEYCVVREIFAHFGLHPVVCNLCAFSSVVTVQVIALTLAAGERTIYY